MAVPNRLNDETIRQYCNNPSQTNIIPPVLEADVLIAGSGPVGAAYARVILDSCPDARVIMADIGSQDSPVIGAHHKNSIKYQKDIDKFVNVINGALQVISLSPADTYISSLGGDGWRPSPQQELIFQGSNPNQVPELNLKASSITRAVGGMGTHWTCACPIPHQEERVKNPIPWNELSGLLDQARVLLNVHEHEYDHSIRHTVVKETLQAHLPDPGRVRNLPLAVERRKGDPRYVTWTGPNTVLGDVVNNPGFKLLAEHRVTRVLKELSPGSPERVFGVLLRDLKNSQDIFVKTTAVVLCCGAVATPQILFNSGINPPPLGHYLSEQSIAFCQIVLKQEIVDAIRTDPRFEEAVRKHHERYPQDPLPIPFLDPEPQLTLPYSTDYPWHVQIHRDAFSYGEVGPRADSRVVVDLRWFGRQEIKESNCVNFSTMVQFKDGTWKPGVTDIYGMPQPTFYVQRSHQDDVDDQRMMGEMTAVANILGSYLPGSNPQFMDPGLALHITGTTRIGLNPKESVADANSRVHGFSNLWVGGNGCIPDSTACNPTRTSVAIAIKGARTVVEYLKSLRR